MDFERYTERSRGFVQAAQTLALTRGHQRLTPEHLLQVLLADEQGLAAGLIACGGRRPEGRAGRDRGRAEEAARWSRAPAPARSI